MGPPGGGGQGRSWLFVASLALVAAFVALAAFKIGREKSDFDGYVRVGKTVLDGAGTYRDLRPGNRVWPPAFAVSVAPLASLASASRPVAIALWQAGSLAALAWALVVVSRLAYGRRLTLSPKGEGLLPASPTILVPLALAYEGVTGNLMHVQVNLMLFALVLQGLVWQANGRPALGGWAIGTAAALKVMPLVFLPYLVWRRRWRAAAWTTAAIVVVSLAPIAVLGWERFAVDASEWKATLAAGWNSGWMNQSMPAAFDRYLGHGVVPFVTAPTSDLPVSGSPAVAVAVWATRGLAAALAVWLFRGPMRPAGRAALAEWSVVFGVGAVFGQVSWKHYDVVFLLPYALLLSLALDGRCSRGTRRWAVALLLVALVLSALPSRDVVGSRLGGALEMAGAYAIAGTAVVLGLFVVRRRLRHEPDEPPALA